MSNTNKLVEIHKHRLFKPFISFLVLILAINVLYLDFKASVAPKTPIIIKSANKQTPVPNVACPTSCISEINYATSSMQFSNTGAVSSTVVNSSVKDYYVTFGSGTSTATTWTDVVGLQSNINPSNYPNIAQIVFEVSMYIPTGNQFASIRLWDVTDGYAVWNSEMTISGGQPQYLVSNPITLAPGNKLYQVQMLTQLQAPAIINQSRLHITLN